MIRTRSLGHSHQPLQRPLLVDLIGAVRHVGLEVGLSVLGDDVADVIDDNVLLVPLLQLLEEPKGNEGGGEGMSRATGTRTGHPGISWGGRVETRG